MNYHINFTAYILCGYYVVPNCSGPLIHAVEIRMCNVRFFDTTVRHRQDAIYWISGMRSCLSSEVLKD